MELGIELISNQSVLGIDRKAHSVELSEGQQIQYERLLLATGATRGV